MRHAAARARSFTPRGHGGSRSLRDRVNDERVQPRGARASTRGGAADAIDPRAVAEANLLPSGPESGGLLVTFGSSRVCDIGELITRPLGAGGGRKPNKAASVSKTSAAANETHPTSANSHCGTSNARMVSVSSRPLSFGCWNTNLNPVSDL